MVLGRIPSSVIHNYVGFWRHLIVKNRVLQSSILERGNIAVRGVAQVIFYMNWFVFTPRVRLDTRWMQRLATTAYVHLKLVLMAEIPLFAKVLQGLGPHTWHLMRVTGGLKFVGAPHTLA